MADDHAPAAKPTRGELLARITAPTDPTEYRAYIQLGLDDIAAGRRVSGDRVRAWVRSLGTDHELPPPECD